MARIIRMLEPVDFERGFVETLTALAPVDLTREELEAIHQMRKAAGVQTWVMSDEDQVIGTASLLVERKFIRRGGWVGHVEDVAVRSENAGQGIGSALVEHITAEACRLGCYKVILNCLDHLIPFYSRLGYRRHDSGMRMNCHECQTTHPTAETR
jgi:glucosamine-phosphate N-acetyltransferase